MKLLSKVIAKNIKYSAVNKAVNMLYSLIFFPFIIHYVGKEVYGIYLLVLTIAGYLSLLDMGVGATVVKYVAEYNGKGDSEKVNSIISFSLTFFVAIAAIIAVFLFILSFYFDAFFNITALNREIARRLFWVAGFTALVYWPNLLFKNVLMGLQRYEWSSLGDIILVIVNSAAAFIIFPRGGSMVDFQIVALFAVSAILVFYFIMSKSVLSNLRISFPYFNRATYKLIFKYSIFLFLSGIVGTIIFQIGHVAAGLFISVAAVTLYGVAFSMQQNIRSINAIIGSPFMPASSELHGRDDLESQRSLFFQGTRFSNAFFFPIIIIAVVFTKDFIISWMGPTFHDSVRPAQILLLFWFFAGSTDIGANILYGKGIVNVFFWISVLCAIFTLSLTLILVKPLGIIGIALGITIPMILINFPLSLYFVLKKLKISLWDFCEKIIGSNLLLYILAAITAFTIRRIYVPDNVYLVIFEMMAIYIVCLAVYYFVILNKEDRMKVRRVVGI